MKGVLWLILLAGGGFAAYTIYQQMHVQSATPAGRKQYKAKSALPAGASMTGRVTQTNTGRPPGFGAQTSGYIPKFWAEVRMPSSNQMSWIEVVEA